MEQVMATGFKSLRGQLLLDGGSLGGSFFHRAVVLICHHDAEGAFGLVLNRPAGGTLGELVVADLPDALREEPVFLGGPVQPSAFSYLLTEDDLLEANVLPKLTLGHSLDSLADLAGSKAASRKVRVFAGYSGWSPGQLESEMKRKAWLTHPASVELVFRTPVERLWKEILTEKGWEKRLLADAPDDYSVN
jgi:putative transcriptional regulator